MLLKIVLKLKINKYILHWMYFFFQNSIQYVEQFWSDSNNKIILGQINMYVL